MSESVDVNIRGHETVSPAAKAAGDAVQGLTEKTQELGEKTSKTAEQNQSLYRSFVDVKAGIDLAIGIAKTAIGVVRDLTNEYAEQERQVKIFDQAMKLSNTITKTQADDLRVYADTIKALTGIDDEQILAMETYLATSGRTAEQIKELISAAVSLSAATGDNLNTTVEQLNKTFSGSIGRMGQLIPELQELTKEQLAHGEAVRVVAEKYKGLDAEMGSLSGTTMKNLGNAFSDLKAAAGGWLFEANRPAIINLTTIFNWLADAINRVVESEKKIREQGPISIVIDTTSKQAGGVSEYVRPEKGYARGTSGAAPGAAVVGENGPEVVLFHGGETVIPNHMLRRLPGYADGAGPGIVGLSSNSLNPLAGLMDIIGPLVSSFGSMLTSLSSVNAILNPFQTILQGMFEIIGPLVNQALAPLVGILKIIGQVLGKTLAPVIEFFGNVIKGLAWGLVKVINGVIEAINWVLPKRWEIDKVSLSDATSAGQSSTSSSSVTGASASYTKQRDITNYFTINTAALVGDDGFRQFCLLVGRELQSTGVLGMA